MDRPSLQDQAALVSLSICSAQQHLTFCSTRSSPVFIKLEKPARQAVQLEAQLSNQWAWHLTSALLRIPIVNGAASSILSIVSLASLSSL